MAQTDKQTDGHGDSMRGQVGENLGFFSFLKFFVISVCFILSTQWPRLKKWPQFPAKG